MKFIILFVFKNRFGRKKEWNLIEQREQDTEEQRLACLSSTITINKNYPIQIYKGKIRRSAVLK